MATGERLAGRFALVTGASRGIGRAIATRLAADGATVAVHYGNSKVEADRVVADIGESGGQAFAVRADMKDIDAIATMFEAIDRELDILVNNAGIGSFRRLAELDAAAFDRLLAVNLRAPVLVTRHALERLRDGGRIINLSSGLSRRPNPMTIGYSMTKAAIDAFTQALAGELGPRGITVNAVAPGWTQTDGNATQLADPATRGTVIERTAMGRLGTPEDIASVVAFLASGESGWVTGQYIEASGGFTLPT
jgi:3-oxoacyl-[acyl-carrier protein] reductase